MKSLVVVVPISDDDGRQWFRRKTKKSPKRFGKLLWGDRLWGVLAPEAASGVVKWLTKIVEPLWGVIDFGK